MNTTLMELAVALLGGLVGGWVLAYSLAKASSLREREWERRK